MRLLRVSRRLLPLLRMLLGRRSLLRDVPRDGEPSTLRGPQVREFRWSMPKGSPPRVYEIRATFRAPLPFVYAWCTDYSTEDPRLEKERYARRIVRRSARQVVYEDLTEAPRGWIWSRQTVTLLPPNRWHANSVGSHRTWSLDYTLRERPAGGTELTLRGVRRATAIGGPNPPKAKLEQELRRSWRNFGAELEKDFRRGRARSPRSASRRTAR